MTSVRVRIENFDAYDRHLLWNGLRAGYRYVKVQNGRHGYWVKGPLAMCPTGFAEAGPGRIIKLEEIEGLTRLVRQPAVDPGPWLQSLELD